MIRGGLARAIVIAPVLMLAACAALDDFQYAPFLDAPVKIERVRIEERVHPAAPPAITDPPERPDAVRAK